MTNIEALASYDDTARLDVTSGSWGIPDPTDLGNGHFVNRWGKLPSDSPLLEDVLKFLSEQCGAVLAGYYTPVGMEVGNTFAGYLPTKAVFEHSSGRKLSVEVVELANCPNVLIPLIAAWYGRKAGVTFIYPGFDTREEQKSGPPMDLEKPWVEMGPRCYRPSENDDATKWPPFNPFDKKDISESEYVDADQARYRVTERMTSPGSIFAGGPKGSKARVWQKVAW